MVLSRYRWFARTFLILTVFVSATSFLWHPFFVSVTELDYNATDKTLEISCKVFTDDLEKALVKFTNTRVDIYNPKDKSVLEKQIAGYISRHFQIKVDGKPVSMEYIGYEI